MNIAKQLATTGVNPNSPLSVAQQHINKINQALPNKKVKSQITVKLTNNQAWDQAFSFMANDKDNAAIKGQIDYSGFKTQKEDGTNVACCFENIGVFASGFTVAVTHPAGIWGFRDYFKEAHLIAPAFSYNVGVEANIGQFDAPIWQVSVDNVQQVPTSLADDVTKAATGNTLTSFAVVVDKEVALTRSSDLVVVIKAGMYALFTFQTYIVRGTK